MYYGYQIYLVILIHKRQNTNLKSKIIIRETESDINQTVLLHLKIFIN